MPVDEIRNMFLRRIFQDFVGKLVAAVVVAVCIGLISMVVPAFNSFDRTVSLGLILLLFLFLLLSNMFKVLKDLAVAYKKWDIFPVRILNKISDSQGNLRITLDSPIFSYYTARDSNEKSKLEQQDIVIIVACGTRFITLY